MRFLPAVFLLLAASSCRWSTSASEPLGGFTVGNGGGTITCAPDAALKAAGGAYFEGTYNVDYLLTYDVAAASEEPQGKPWEVLRDRLIKVLGDKLAPAAAQSFATFASQIESTNPTNAFVWQPSDEDLNHLSDEHLEQTPPSNCLTNGQPNINQVIVHKRQSDHPDKVFMLYDRQRLAALKAQPLQFSFLMVHEWLWSLTGESWPNRTFNRLLQDTKIDSMTPAQVRDFFATFDVYVSDHGFLIPNGPKDFDLQAAVKADTFCDWNNHIRSDFLGEALHVLLAPGETRVLPLTLPPPPDAFGPNACGVGLELSYAFVSAQGQSFDVALTRSVLTFSASVPQGAATDGQALWLGLCQDPLCAQPTGDLAGMLISATYPSGAWTLTVHNRGSEPLDLRWPELILVKMAP